MSLNGSKTKIRFQLDISISMLWSSSGEISCCKYFGYYIMEIMTFICTVYQACVQYLIDVDADADYEKADIEIYIDSQWCTNV